MGRGGVRPAGGSATSPSLPPRLFLPVPPARDGKRLVCRPSTPAIPAISHLSALSTAALGQLAEGLRSRREAAEGEAAVPRELRREAEGEAEGRTHRPEGEEAEGRTHRREAEAEERSRHPRPQNLQRHRPTRTTHPQQPHRAAEAARSAGSGWAARRRRRSHAMRPAPARAPPWRRGDRWPRHMRELRGRGGSGPRPATPPNLVRPYRPRQAQCQPSRRARWPRPSPCRGIPYPPSWP